MIKVIFLVVFGLISFGATFASTNSDQIRQF